MTTVPQTRPQTYLNMVFVGPIGSLRFRAWSADSRPQSQRSRVLSLLHWTGAAWVAAYMQVASTSTPFSVHKYPCRPNRRATAPAHHFGAGEKAGMSGSCTGKPVLFLQQHSARVFVDMASCAGEMRIPIHRPARYVLAPTPKCR